MADVNVTIDGIKVQVPDGTYMIDAARKIGIDIPNYCYLPGLRAYGACRFCAVETKGRKGWEIGISCSMPAKEGTEIRTLTDQVWEQRHMLMELLDVDHPLDCPICEANGDCRLQDWGYEYGVIGKELRRPKIVRPAERLSPAIDLDRDRCVVCGRCIRACDEQIGAVALAFAQRGIETVVDAPFGKSLMDTPCVECGTCVEVCPVGALSSRIQMHPVHHWQQRKTRSTCQSCSVGCTMQLGVHNNLLAEIRSQDSIGINDGIICVKGRYGQDVVNDKARLTTPLIRQADGSFQIASWPEALDLVAAKLAEHKAAAGAIAGSKLTNEELYLLQKIMRGGLGSNNIDSDARYPENEALAVLEEAFGYGAMTNNLLDTRQQAGCILIVGDSIYETHPVYAYQLQRLIRIRSAKVVVISPRWNKMSEWATLTLAPKPGTEEILLHGIAQLISSETIGTPGLAAKATGYEAWVQSLAGYSPEDVSRLTGVPVADMIRAAYLYASGGKLAERPKSAPAPDAPAPQYPAATIVFSARGPYVLTPGAVRALCNLALITGNVGRAGGGVNPLVGDANSLGLNDMGCRPDRLPGYAPIDAANLARFTAEWTIDPGNPVQVSATPGLSCAEMLQGAAQGTLRALLIAGSNPVVGASDPEAARAALRQLDFLVVQDLFMNETAELAHVVLPAASYAEKDGTYTNTERRVQRVRKAREPVGQARTDSHIFVELGYRLGLSMPYPRPADVMDEIARLVPIYAGINYARLEVPLYLEDAIPMPGATSYKQLRVNGLQWPCLSADHAGTAVLYAAGAGGQPRLTTAPATGPGAATAPAAPDGGLLMIAGFSLFPYRTGTTSRHSRSLAKVQPHSRLHLHPADATRLGLHDVEQVRVQAAGGNPNGAGNSELNNRPVDAITLVSEQVPPGTAFLAMTLAQAGRSPLVRQALEVQKNGHDGVKAVPIVVTPIYGAPTGDARLGPGPATENVVGPANAATPPA
ncbi:MAG TPA: molybdopterin-dependent oxidoreductase [Chloroflexia bacterium]|nr:molybdopterin-dependent oxidoreductase [Chloroflexia bacterium]